MKKTKYLLAFSLIETAIVLLIISILIAAITQGSRLVKQSRLTTARTLTQRSPVALTNGLILWFDTLRENSLQNSNLAFDVEDGDKIQNWYSINPQLIDAILATQSTAANQPTYIDSGINKLPSLYFNGSHHLQIPDSSTISLEAGITIFVVIQPTLLSGFQGIVSKEVSSGIGNPPYQIYINSGTDFKFAITSAAGITIVTNTSITPVVSAKYIICGSFAATQPPSIRISPNQSKTYLGSSSATSMVDSSGVLRIGQQKSGFSRFFYGYLSEVIIFNRALQSSEIYTINDYLSKKYNITLS